MTTLTANPTVLRPVASRCVRNPRQPRWQLAPVDFFALGA